MALQRKLLMLDQAALTDAVIAPAGSGLPRRIWAESATLPAVVMGLAPSAFYMMDEPSGAVLADSSGFGVNGTIDSATFGAAGKDGLCLGTTGSILATVPRNAAFEPHLTQPWSMQLWVYGKLSYSTGGLPWISSLTAAPYSGLHGWADTSAVYFALYSAGTPMYVGLSSIPFIEGQWNHLCITKDASGTVGGVRAYVNGALAPLTRVGSLSATIAYGAALNIAGSAGAGGNLEAGVCLDMLAFWSLELTASQVGALVYGSAPLARASWTFDLGAGTTIREVAVPGNLARRRSATVDGRLTRLYVAFPTVARVEYEPGVDLALAATVDVTLDIDFAAASDGVPPYLGGPLGEGPVVIYDDGISGSGQGGAQASFSPLAAEPPGILQAQSTPTGLVVPEASAASIVLGD